MDILLILYRANSEADYNDLYKLIQSIGPHCHLNLTSAWVVCSEYNSQSVMDYLVQNIGRSSVKFLVTPLNVPATAGLLDDEDIAWLQRAPAIARQWQHERWRVRMLEVSRSIPAVNPYSYQR